MSGQPERPQIPPIAWFAVAMCAGSVVAEHLVWPDRLGWGIVAVWAVTLVLGVVWIARARLPAVIRTGALVACAGLLAGCALSVLQSWAWLRQQACVADCGARQWVGVVEADPVAGDYGPSVRVRLRGGPLEGGVVRVGWPSEAAVPDLGRTVRFSAILKPLPVAEAWARRSARAGLCASGNAWRAETGAWREGPLGALFSWRAAMLARMHAVPGAGADLAEGIVLGDRRRLIGTDTEEDFRILGLTHLVAVSGSHLAAACAAVAFVGALLRVPRRPLVAATVAAGAVYAIVTGLPFSALRSLLMLAVAGAAQMAGRRADGIASLSAAVVAVVALQPWAVFDLGLQLSALAVFGLLVFGRLVAEWATWGLTGWQRLAGQALALTLVAQLTTVPVVASAFGMVSLLAPVANAVVGPLVSVAMLVGLAGAVAGTVLPAAGTFGASAAATVLGAAAHLADVMARVPGAAVAVGGGPWFAVATAVLLGVLWLRWPLPKKPGSGRRFLAAVTLGSMLVALGPAPPQRCAVTVLDVGQGDAILVRDSGRVMLVDTGPDELALRRALARSGVRRIDVLVLTHAHGDHTGGAGGLVGVAEVDWIGIPDVAREEPVADDDVVRDPWPGARGWSGPECPVRPLKAGDTWRIGGTVVEVQWPVGGDGEQLGANDTSVVLALHRGEFDMVLTGDAERLVQERLLAAGEIHEVEVLKVPHHGSTNGLTVEGLSAWSPQDAIISVGAGNDFGHPCPETLALLEEAGVRTWRTDEFGDITVSVGVRGYRVCGARRGTADVVRARMRDARSARSRCPSPPPSESVPDGSCRSQDDRGPQERLPDLRRRGAVARSRAPPSQGPHRRGGRPRLQLRGVRRRVGRRERGGGGSEHAPVRLRATPRDRPGCRQDERCGAGGVG